MKVAIIGIGNMGQALVECFLKKGAHKTDEIFIYDKDTGRALAFALKTGCRACTDPEEAVKNADVVLLAVKPQVMKTAINDSKEFIDKDALVISIAAGITVNTLREMLGMDEVPIVRVMPNTPAMIGEGASALCFSNVPDVKIEYATALFDTCGITVKVDEKSLDAVTGVSGSGPAYGLIFIEAMADAGVKLGLTREVATRLAAMTLKGAASMVLETGKTPGELKDQVCSPGGTTISAVHVLEKAGFRAAVMDAVCAAAARSGELSKEK
ncbi:MAG: pyrroline-5-carboxylate reductase [Saccharofermentanales bacterium]